MLFIDCLYQLGAYGSMYLTVNDIYKYEFVQHISYDVMIFSFQNRPLVDFHIKKSWQTEIQRIAEVVRHESVMAAAECGKWQGCGI